ncbi:hypothetical protein AVEN_108049-1 [Araneus ventricosus]|uniref:Uncharacterized protein n=1 Tax=Araneus ventricosus TaxID=182803 RepID=A0A4Y2TUV4_ARAVE|nr:hypothetical protein AVEN_108049-1 [Araneus ventricosus]
MVTAQEPFQVLEQMLIAGSKIGTIGGWSNISHRNLKRFVADQYFPCDDDVQMAGFALRRRTKVYTNWSHRMTRASIPVVVMLRGS